MDVNVTPHQLVSPLWKAIETDTSDILDVLLTRNQGHQYDDLESLLKLALEKSSVDCLQVLAKHVPSEPRPDNSILSLAQHKGMNYIRPLLSLGYCYTQDFVNKYQNSLQEYYLNIGLAEDHFEGTCGEFTKTFLSEDEEQRFNYTVTSSALTAVLERMCKRYTNFDVSTDAETKSFYKDLMCTIDELIIQQPDLFQQIPQSFFEPCLKTVKDHICNLESRYNENETISFFRFLQFLVEKGWLIPTDTLVSAIDIKPTYWSPCETATLSLLAKHELLDKSLSQHNASPKEKIDILTKWVGKVYQSYSFHAIRGVATGYIQHDLATITHTLSLLPHHGLDLYSLPPTDITLPGSPIVHHFTPFQAVAFIICKRAQMRSMVTHEVLRLLETLIQVIGKWADFSKEMEHISGYTEVMETLADLLTTEGRSYGGTSVTGASITNRLLGHLAITPSAIIFWKYMLSTMTPRVRRTAADAMMLYKNKRVYPQYIADIGEIVDKEIKPLLGVQRLVDICGLYCRKYINASKPMKYIEEAAIGNVTEVIEMMTDVTTDTERDDDVTANPETSHQDVSEVSGITEVMTKLDAKGLCGSCVTPFSVKVRTLPLPLPLQRLLLGQSKLDNAFKQLWSAMGRE